MILDDLKEQFTAAASNIGHRIQETSAYQQLKERFDALSYSAQKMVVVGTGFFIWFLILMIPFTWYNQSQENVTAFEERRAVIRELLKVSREASEVPPIPPAPPVETMKSDLEMRLKSANLLPEQIKSIEVTQPSSNLIPAERSAGELTFHLWKLNVRQVVDVGTQLSRLSASVKLTAMEMIANKEDPRYFDVTYKATALAVPDLSAPPSVEEPRAKNNGRRGSSGTPKSEDGE